MSKSKKNTSKKARVHKDLEGLELKINDLGEVESSLSIDEINKFLDKNVKDKKIDEDVKRADYDEQEEEEEEGDPGK